MKHKPRYSGKKSRKFWNKIAESDDEAYLIGVILQEFEANILKILKDL